MKQILPLSAAVAMCAIISAAIIPSGAQAATQRGACEVMPGAAAQAVLGAGMETHEIALATTNGSTTTTCNYIGREHGATLMLYYQGSAAEASASASNITARLSGNGRISRRGHGSGLAGSKGNVVVIVSVRERGDVGKLKPLLATAMSGL